MPKTNTDCEDTVVSHWYDFIYLLNTVRQRLAFKYRMTV